MVAHVVGIDASSGKAENPRCNSSSIIDRLISLVEIIEESFNGSIDLPIVVAVGMNTNGVAFCHYALQNSRVAVRCYNEKRCWDVLFFKNVQNLEGPLGGTIIKGEVHRLFINPELSGQRCIQVWVYLLVLQELDRWPGGVFLFNLQGRWRILVQNFHDSRFSDRSSSVAPPRSGTHLSSLHLGLGHVQQSLTGGHPQPRGRNSQLAIGALLSSGRGDQVDSEMVNFGTHKQHQREHRKID